MVATAEEVDGTFERQLANTEVMLTVGVDVHALFRATVYVGAGDGGYVGDGHIGHLLAVELY